MVCERHYSHSQYLTQEPGNYSGEEPTFSLCGTSTVDVWNKHCGTGASGTRTVEQSPLQSGTGAVRPYSRLLYPRHKSLSLFCWTGSFSSNIFTVWNTHCWTGAFNSNILTGWNTHSRTVAITGWNKCVQASSQCETDTVEQLQWDHNYVVCTTVTKVRAYSVELAY